MKLSLTAAQLRVLALALMFLDHAGRVLFPVQLWMVCLGRLAFPIFAFQTAEGYRHTHDFHRYCLRLAVFALISEIPFDLMAFGTFFYYRHQNVMLTMLFGLLCCRAWDRKKPWVCFLLLLAGAFTLCDYGSPGILTVLLFHVCRGRKWELLAAMVLLNCFAFGFLTLQSWAVLAWIPIIRCNGEKGSGGKWLQYGSYAFYPLHMLILSLL